MESIWQMKMKGDEIQQAVKSMTGGEQPGFFTALLKKFLPPKLDT